ncbi:MAG: superinfection immunity protein [Alphaproteobacteria bacterium]|nr:superinfection immunity protein [Alphaproteobacteria bacterium]
MITTTEILLYAKYAIGILITLAIIFAPAWLARQNGRGKPDMHAVRLASWVFGWSIIGWLWSLYWATKK